MRFEIYCRRFFPTNRRTDAINLIYRTMISEHRTLEEMFGVRDWSILLKYVYFYVTFLRSYVRSSDGFHNSDNRPGMYNRSEGEHLTLWGFTLGQKRSSIYIHICADHSATFGRNTRKILKPELCNFLGRWDVVIFRFLPSVFKTDNQI